MQILQNTSLRGYNTFGLEVRADWFAEVRSVDDLIGLVRDPKFQPMPPLPPLRYPPRAAHPPAAGAEPGAAH